MEMDMIVVYISDIRLLDIQISVSIHWVSSCLRMCSMLFSGWFGRWVIFAPEQNKARREADRGYPESDGWHSKTTNVSIHFRYCTRL